VRLHSPNAAVTVSGHQSQAQAPAQCIAQARARRPRAPPHFTWAAHSCFVVVRKWPPLRQEAPSQSNVFIMSACLAAPPPPLWPPKSDQTQTQTERRLLYFTGHFCCCCSCSFVLLMRVGSFSSLRGSSHSQPPLLASTLACHPPLVSTTLLDTHTHKQQQQRQHPKQPMQQPHAN